ncbi:MAG: cupredoxin domain-containing protein [Actinomycetota bacterium]|nr:cupredoxin domain-containing protein [Actinomycetota bacterium]
MKTKLATTLAIAALAPFALVACGDDDDEATPTDTPPATEQTDTGDDTGGEAAGGSAVEISADPGGSLAFEQDSAEAEAGAVTISLSNESSTPHDVRVESPEGEDLGGTETISGDTTEATVDLDAGDYTFYCSVAGHREAGMEGALAVN